MTAVRRIAWPKVFVIFVTLVTSYLLFSSNRSFVHIISSTKRSMRVAEFLRDNYPVLLNSGDRGSLCSTLYVNTSDEIYTKAYHEENQRERKSRVRRVCQLLNPSNRSEFLRDLHQRKRLHHIYVIPAFNAVYCSVPKVSCTNWKRLLSVISGYIKNYETIVDPHRFARRHFRRLSALTPEEVENVLDTHTKFMFARNPYTRVLSAYMEKIVYQPEARWTGPIYNWLKKNHPNMARRNSTGTLTFDQFLTFYANSTEAKNEHWEDMHKLCFPCHIDYDFIGQYESLKPESDYLLDLINAPEDARFPDPHKNPTYSSDKLTLQNKYALISDIQLKDLSHTPGFLIDSLLFGYAMPECIHRANSTTTTEYFSATDS